jgi:hypothetical protein
MGIRILFTATLLLAAVTAGDAQPASPPGARCQSASLRALDFWIGRWDVKNPAGQRTAGSEIEVVADGCGILERYMGVAGPAGNKYIGTGLHVFDATVNGWRQLWSDNRPGVTVMNGRQTDAGVVYEWEVVDPQGKRVPKRYTLSRADAGTVRGVRQLGERSDDGGKTWTVEFDLRYVPAPPGL